MLFRLVSNHLQIFCKVHNIRDTDSGRLGLVLKTSRLVEDNLEAFKLLDTVLKGVFILFWTALESYGNFQTTLKVFLFGSF